MDDIGNRNSDYFEQVIKDAKLELRKYNITFVFSMEQVQKLLEDIPDLNYKKIENRWYQVRTKEYEDKNK